jgi:hypothetical protein
MVNADGQSALDKWEYAISSRSGRSSAYAQGGFPDVISREV